jgi:hypothetical protein
VSELRLFRGTTSLHSCAAPGVAGGRRCDSGQVTQQPASSTAYSMYEYYSDTDDEAQKYADGRASAVDSVR